jgi:2-phosphoglycerate kinase
LTVTDDHDMPIVDQGSGAPFSKGIMAQTLMATGLAPEKAYAVAAAVARPLRPPGPAALTVANLQRVAHEQLGDLQGEILIQRFRQWQKLRRLETPMIVLIGGATGVGKSTLATELAHRLGITRVISTDMVRQTMRAFFAPELMPAIHTSSFDAAAAVRVPVPRETDLSKVGFMEQTKAVAVGLEALVQRGIDEAQQMVVEGVHIVPGYLDSSRWREALVLEFVLAVGDRDRHRSNFTVREWETGGIRPLRRYIEHFAQIRRIQKYIVGRAQDLGVPVIDNISMDENLHEVLGTILHRVEEYSEGANGPAAGGGRAGSGPGGEPADGQSPARAAEQL